MSKVWDKPITADTDWGGDASTDNLPVSGRQVQAWIKGNIKNDDAISLLIAKWLNEHTTNSITFWKGLPIDSGTLKWVDEHLTVIGGTGSSETPQDLPFIYDPVKKAWEFKGDFVVTGAITMFGSLSGFRPSTVTEAVEVDGETIVKTKNSLGQWQLTAIGGGSGTGGGISAAEVNILIENALKPYIKIATADDKYALISTVSDINSRLSAVETFFASEDSDTLINKWSEIVAFLNATEGDTLDNILATKANQSALDTAVASLSAEIGKKWTQNDAKISNWDSAYGWGNHANAGYAAKTYVDAELAKYVKLATAQKIDAQHNFVNGLQIGGLPITKSASANNTIYLDANLVVSGAITMFGSGSTTFPTIWENIPFNLEHLSWDGSQWNIIGGGGSGGLDTNAVNVLISEYLTRNSYATVSDISSALVGYATQSWVSDNYLSKSGGIVSGSFRAFEVKRTDEIGSFVSFSNYTGYMGSLGFRNTDMPGFFDSAGSAYFLIHSNNIGDYALPITGGTVNGDISIPVARATLDNSIPVSGGLDRYGKNYHDALPELKTFIGTIESSDFGWQYTISVRHRNGYSDGATEGFVLRHSLVNMNDSIHWSHQRGGVWSDDRVLLDSSNYSSYALPITGGTVNGNVTLNRLYTTEGVVLTNTGNSYSGLIPNNRITSGGQDKDFWLYNSNGAINHYATSYAFEGGNASFRGSITAVGNIYLGDDSESMLVMNRDYYNRFVAAKAGGRFAWRVNGQIDDVLVLDESGYLRSPIGFVGNLTGNADSATKLQTPRTIWGQSFDGSGDITGSPSFPRYININRDATSGAIIDSSALGCEIETYSSHIAIKSLSNDGVNISSHLCLIKGGNVAIGGTTADAKLHVHGTTILGGDTTINGNLLTTGVITMFSQASLKNEVDRFGLTLEQLSMIEPVRFTWKDNRDSLVHAGGIADEVMRVLPEVVHRTKDDKLTMDYGSAGFFIAASLIKPVIDHEQRLQSAEKEIIDLKAENKRLREQLRVV